MSTESGDEKGERGTETKHSTLGRIELSDEWVRSDPVDSPVLLEAYKEKLKARYLGSFANEEEFELFCMLPVAERQREELFRRMQHPRVVSVSEVLKKNDE
jgi:hypothetical protein